MARDSQTALVALNRFGFGARGGASGDLVNAASDPRGFVKAELNRANGVLLQMPGLQSTPALAEAVFAYQAEVKRAREAAAKAAAPARRPRPATDAKVAAAKPFAQQRRHGDGGKDAGDGGTGEKRRQRGDAIRRRESAMQPNAAKPPPQPLNIIQKTYRAEALARLQRAIIADCGFVERLVAFWSNHFCISANKGELARMWAGSFEREAIRPYVLGRFADMLKAVEQHPAMLFFLDNQQSLGPDSRAGRNRKRGLNENLAREIMELHTLGVGGGYTQDDVTSLARIITGWTFAGRQGRLGRPAVSYSTPMRTSRGRSGCSAELTRTTASRRAKRRWRTSRAIPPPRNSSRPNSRVTSWPTIRRRLWWRGCRRCFATSDGDLRALATALLDSDEAWQAPLTKMRSPYEFLVATGRLLARIPEDPGVYLGGLNLLGQPLWSPAGPNGFPDTNAAWAAPEGMKLRLDIAAQVASRLGGNIDPRDLLELAAADAASPETRRTVERAESRQQALALLLMSPEFQRR